MRRISMCLILFCLCSKTKPQVKWDGGGDGISWNDPANWFPDGIPVATSNVILDNSIVLTTYNVNLASTGISTFVNTLRISPASDKSILLKIPPTNTANPGLNVGGMGDALIIDSGAILINSTGVASGGVGLVLSNTFRINNGGKYIHNNIRGNAGIVSQLSTAVGTEKGMFEFDVPGTAGYTVSLSGRTFGTLIFSANATGIPRTYTGNGASNLTIRGDLTINTGATLSCTISSNVIISGNLLLAGVLDANPSTVGTVNRSILFSGANQIISGSGNFVLGPNFRNLEIIPGAALSLQRNITLSNPNQGFVVDSGGALVTGLAIINGSGRFQLNKSSTLAVGSADGITIAPAALGNIQTAIRIFAGDANYEYNGAGPQVTGDGLPNQLTGRLKINNAASISSLGVTLSNSTSLSSSTGILDLSNGKLRSSSGSIINIGPGASIVNYSANSFIGGPLKVTGHSAFTYPIGLNAPLPPTGSIYAPVTMNDTTSNGSPTESYTAEYFRANPSGTIGAARGDSIDHVSFVEYWRIIRTDSANNPSAKQLTLEVNPESSCYHIDSTLVARYDTVLSEWKSEGRTSFYRNPSSGFPLEWGRISSESHITAFGFFTLATTLPFAGNPLPIRLISFDASRIGNSSASIRWELGDICSPATRFELQKAGRDKKFSPIAVVHAAANERSYQFLDDSLVTGINFYRLMVIDEDQNNTLSRTAVILKEADDLLLVSLAPNPASSNAVLTIVSSRRQQVDLLVIDILGRTIIKKEFMIPVGESRVDLSISELNGGVYHIIGSGRTGKTNALRFIK